VTDKLKISFLIQEFLYIVIVTVLFYFSSVIYTNKVIQIPSGSVNYIISYLTQKQQPLNLLDNIALRLMGSPQKGWIDIGAYELSRLDYLHKLTTSKAPTTTVTLIPGETYYFFLKEIASKLNLSFEKLKLAYDKQKIAKDGNILADSYNIPHGASEDRVIFFLIEHSKKRYEKFSQKIFSDFNQKNWYRYITIASIIQKESASIKEMPIVSSVIHNRLKIGMPLQMDGTLNYGEFSHKVITPHMIRTDSSSYNTYKNKGIPTDPICAVSLEAIKAAIKPANTKFLYFVKIKNQNKHKFTTTHKQHKQRIEKNRKIKDLYKNIK